MYLLDCKDHVVPFPLFLRNKALFRLFLFLCFAALLMGHSGVFGVLLLLQVLYHGFWTVSSLYHNGSWDFINILYSFLVLPPYYHWFLSLQLSDCKTLPLLMLPVKSHIKIDFEICVWRNKKPNLILDDW